jgi:hypothetical protein
MLAEDPDVRGKTIGIVSAVAMDFTQGLVPMITPVWDIGLILPITEAVRLLMDLKAGRAKGNGMIDFSQEAILSADSESWEFLLSLAAQQKLREQRRKTLRTDQEWAEHTARAERFEKMKQESVKLNKKRRDALASLWASVGDRPVSLEEKRDLLK